MMKNINADNENDGDNWHEIFWETYYSMVMIMSMSVSEWVSAKEIVTCQTSKVVWHYGKVEEGCSWKGKVLMNIALATN